MFRIIFQLMILIYIILVVYNILNLQKYNINGFIFDTDNIEVVKENIQKLNPVDFYKENNFNIFNPQYNYIQDITNYRKYTRRTIKAQCFPLYSILKALGNPTVHYLRY